MASPQEENVQLNFCNTTKEEEFLLTESTGFYEEFEDDEVFLVDSQITDMDRSSDIPPRPRRTSDVIDCHGGAISSAHNKRHSFTSLSGDLVYSATSKATNIRELNTSRRTELTTETLDQGYSSPGAQSSSRSFKGTTWFRFSTSNDADSVDAIPFSVITAGQKILNPSNSNNELSPESKKLSDAASMPVAQDALCYNMDHENRGFAVIINNDIFDPHTSLSERSGSWKDVEELKTMFYRLHFRVVVWNNLSHNQLIARVGELVKFDHTNNDCLALVVLSHGVNSSYIYAQDSLYPVETLWNSFTADICPSLAGKPKLFFIQACRGEKLDAGVVLNREARTEVDSCNTSYRIPKHADFLIAFSTYDGYYSFRHPEDGTWFIQSLCTEINNHDLSAIDILRIMTRVSRRVALDHESYNPDCPWLHQQKQIPTIHSMLIRDVYFKPKKKPPPEPQVVNMFTEKNNGPY
ncbi:Peptidase C14, caspase non-catalytic subunit p10,Peptidase C14A, caspase catalytic domain,Peptidase [Cinara cedri]|uniref:Peptidase C14, caspase non-catalytic subunit p10,Peptidase C14A, caspase catalytic domain,Peptidase n=1 Tax=Cinara cedri TaxID=506608 RepID=A0A5E4MNU1_9HEMI|nr:Peptidase C14, caspase non-catalytic subunit p10,Peptidase C14A, caspase catalytic domain,Peptidase [Cinara cedri]